MEHILKLHWFQVHVETTRRSSVPEWLGCEGCCGLSVQIVASQRPEERMQSATWTARSCGKVPESSSVTACPEEIAQGSKIHRNVAEKPAMQTAGSCLNKQRDLLR